MYWTYLLTNTCLCLTSPHKAYVMIVKRKETKEFPCLKSLMILIIFPLSSSNKKHFNKSEIVVVWLGLLSLQHSHIDHSPLPPRTSLKS